MLERFCAVAAAYWLGRLAVRPIENFLGRRDLSNFALRMVHQMNKALNGGGSMPASQRFDLGSGFVGDALFAARALSSASRAGH